MTILDLLTACEQTYVLASIVAGPDGRDAATITRTPTGETILAFRGTTTHPDVATLLDWMNDCRAGFTTSVCGVPGKIHAGFAASFADLYAKLLPLLPHYKDPLFITGHSKGGALALLAGAALPHLDMQVVTFAAPLVGNRKFAALYPLRVPVKRFEARNDIVPLLPPFGYHSPGTPIEEEQESWFLRRLHIGELMAEEQWDQIVEAHHLRNYRRWIERLPEANLSGYSELGVG